MSKLKKKTNPTTFIAIGICYMGAGVALSAALSSDGASGVGFGLTGIGIVFLVMGINQKRKQQSSEDSGENEDHPQT